MFEASIFVAALKPAVLAVIACAMSYAAVAVDRWRLLRLEPIAKETAPPSINLAMAIRIATVGIAMAGSLSGLAFSRVEGGLGSAVFLLVFEGVLMMALISVATLIADIVVVPEIPNTEAIRKGNVAVSLVEGSVLIATGQIAGASFASAAATDVVGGLIAALAYFVLAQAVLCLIAYAIRKLSRGDVIRSLEAGDLSPSFIFAAKLLAAGYVMSSIVAGSPTTLVDGLQDLVGGGLIAVVVFGIAYYAGLWLFRLTRSRAAASIGANDLPNAVGIAGLVMVAAFIASVSV